MTADRASSALRVQVVRHYAEFAALAAAWNALVASAQNSVFLRHEWFDAAWQWCAERGELAVMLVREGESLIGIAPLMIAHEKRSRIPVRVLRFLTVPDTQLADLICRPADASRCAAALVQALQRESWDAIVLEYAPQDSPALAAFLQAMSDVTAAVTEPFGTNWSITLGRTWTEYYATRSRRMKKSNNLIVNRLEKSGAVRIDEMRAPRPADELLREIAPISESSWKAGTGTTFDQSGPQRFIRRLTEHALREGWLCVWLLSIDDAPTAYEYQLHYAGNIHGLRSDFNEGIATGLSPGSYLNFKMTQRLFELPASAYYMGPGNNSYKLKWTEGGMELVRHVVYGRGLRGRVLRWVETRAVKWWRQWQSWRARRSSATADEIDPAQAEDKLLRDKADA